MKKIFSLNFLLSFNFIFIFSKPFLGETKEDKLRLITMRTAREYTSTLYGINYYNDYYLPELLKQGATSSKDLIRFARYKFGDKYDFNINSFNNSFACSCFNVYNREGENLFGRNYDYSKSTALIVWTRPKVGYKSISFISGGFLGLKEGQKVIRDRFLLAPFSPVDGLNSAGLGIGVLMLSKNSTHQNNPNLLNITTSLAIRAILDNCQYVEDAISLLEKYNMNTAIEGKNFHFLITDARGSSVVIEYVNNQMIVFNPKKMNNFKYMYVTNFYLANPIEDDWRYNILREHLNKTDVTMDWKEAMNLLNKVHKNNTLWSNIYNTKKSIVYTSYRISYDKFFKFDINVPLRIEYIDPQN